MTSYDLTQFMIFVSDVASTEYMLALVVLLACYLYISKRRYLSLLLLLSSSTSMLITYTLKNIFRIPRPEYALVLETSYRFPSGHATIAAALATLIIYTTYKYFKNNVRKNKNENKNIISLTKYLLYSGAIFWFLLVSYSRIYLGVHYFADVLAGGIIGCTCTLMVAHYLIKGKNI